MQRRSVLALLGLTLCLAEPLWAEPVSVRVGAYHFPPYMIRPESAHPDGLLFDLLTQLNAQQNQYHFEPVATSVQRRYQEFQQGRFDLAFFETPWWGWQGIDFEALPLGIEDDEVYVAKAEPGRDQSYFDRLAGKRLALFRGYRYGFAGFDADPERLIRQFNANLSYSHESNLLMVDKGRADVAVVTRSFLNLFLQKYPELKERFLVSQQADQVYRLNVFLRKQSLPGRDWLMQQLKQLRETGRLQPLLDKYGLRSVSGDLVSRF